MSSTASELLDHAGATYPWFTSVRVSAKGIEVAASDDYTEGDPELRTHALLSVEELRQATRKLVTAANAERYEGRFYRDVLARNWDNADGDQNTVDAILQMAMWGDVVFG